MNTSQQKSFIAAAECLNFTQAAEKLYISQPVLSRNIAALEAELGVLLFVRSSSGLRLTPGGEVMYQWMKEHQISLANAIDQARRANKEPLGELRMGFVTTELIPEREAQAILEFQKRHPDIRLTIHRHSAREITAKLAEHAIHIAGMIDMGGISSDPRFDCCEIACFHSTVAVSKVHPLAELGSISLRAFSNEVFISVDSEYSPVMSEWVRRVCGAAGFVPRIREAPTTNEQMAMVEAQQGVALVTENHVSSQSALVCQVRIREDFPLRYVCVWNRMSSNPAVEKYLEILFDNN